MARFATARGFDEFYGTVANTPYLNPPNFIDSRKSPNVTPVKDDGQRDTSKQVLYIGETQVLTPAGALPIGFEIAAGSLKEAAEKFGQLAKEAIERTVKELQEMRRQAASQIVVPQGPLPPLGGGGGGLGGGGKIQMP